MFNSTYLPNSFFDVYLPLLSEGALRTYLCIARLSPIDRSVSVHLSSKKIREIAGIKDDRTVRKSLAELEVLELLERRGQFEYALTDEMAGGAQ